MEIKTTLTCIDDAPTTYSYVFTQTLAYSPAHVTTIAIIKRGSALDPLAPIAQQLHFLNLFGGDETPYESLHSLVSGAVKPWFDAFVGTRGGGKDGDSKMGACFCFVLMLLRLLMRLKRYTDNEEEICRARALSPSSTAECRNSRNTSHHPPCDPTCSRSGAFAKHPAEYFSRSGKNAQ